MPPDGVFEKTQFPRSQWITFQKLSKVNTRTDQVGNKMVATNRPERPGTPWFHKAMSKYMCQFSISSLASNLKTVQGFKSEASPNESKNLICVVKLYTTEAFTGEKKPSAFELTPWEFTKERMALITHSANQVQWEWAYIWGGGLKDKM